MAQLEKHPIHLGLGSSAIPLPAFTGDMAWYEAYSAEHAADGAEGRIVSLHSFTKHRTSWEMHPRGAEVVVCISGQITLVQERADGSAETIELGPGEYAINAAGSGTRQMFQPRPLCSSLP